MSYARFDEIENVLASLDLLATLTPLVKKRRSRSQWKWIIVAAHDALQGALVCAVADTTGTNVLSKKSAKKMLDWLNDTSKEYPGEYMADFGALLKRAAITLPSGDAKDIRKLHGMRNEFAHFTPKAWSIELAGLPRIINAALRLIERLMQSDPVQYRMTGNRKRRVRFNMKSAKTALGMVSEPPSAENGSNGVANRVERPAIAGQGKTAKRYGCG